MAIKTFYAQGISKPIPLHVQAPYLGVCRVRGAQRSTYDGTIWLRLRRKHNSSTEGAGSLSADGYARLVDVKPISPRLYAKL